LTLCNLLGTLDKAEPDLCRAQVVQCLNALHAFANNGSCRTAWPLTFMPDPLHHHHWQLGGTEIEVETVLRYVKIHDDLRKKVFSGSSRQGKGVDEEEDDEHDEETAAVTRRQKTRAKAKAKAKAP